MFQPFLRTDGYLSGETFSVAEDRGANHSGELGIDQDLTAHNHKRSILFAVATGFVHTIEFSALHV